MPTPDEDEAVRWAVRAADADFDDWAGLSVWLDADPARNMLYNHAVIAAADAAADLARATTTEPSTVLPFVRPAPPRPERWWAAGGLAVAAGVAAMLLLPHLSGAPAPRVIEVPAGAPQRIALADGSMLVAAAGSRILLDPADARRATLVRGRAMFEVRHRADAPFRVAAGAHEIVDLGTAFEVVQAGSTTRVEVAEGAVAVDPARASLRLLAGEGAALRAGAPLQRFAVMPARVGQWREARMSYRDVPLAQLAQDLSAALGRPVSVALGLRDRRFSGTLVPDSFRDRPQALAELLDLRVQAGPEGWHLRAR